MSQALTSPQDCCLPCPSPLVQNIPGPTGPAGAAGADGTDGIDAFTTLTGTFTMPAEGANVTVDVVNSTWMSVGQLVFAGKPASAAKGTFEVISKPNGISAVLKNLANTASSAYLDNSAPGTVFPTATQVAPAGQQGPAGTPGSSGAPVDATYITQTPNGTLSNEQALSLLATGLAKVTTVTGVISTVPLGIAATNVAPVDAGAALTAGQIVEAVAGGLKTNDAATTRGLLSLGTMATQNANNVAITGGTITGVSLPTPSGIPVNELIYEHQEASSTESGVANVSWNVVPLNTEVLDMGGYGSLAANIVTLAAGTWRAQWQINGYGVDKFTTRLFNVDAGTAIAYGNSARSKLASEVTAVSAGVTRFTIGVATQIELQLYAQTQNLTNAYGPALGAGVTEVYSRLVLVKET